MVCTHRVHAASVSELICWFRGPCFLVFLPSPLALNNLSASSLKGFPELGREGFGDIAFRTECSKLSHSLNSDWLWCFLFFPTCFRRKLLSDGGAGHWSVKESTLQDSETACTSQLIYFLHLLVDWLTHVCLRVGFHRPQCTEVWGRTYRIRSLLPSQRSWRSDSGHHLVNHLDLAA